VKPFPIQALKIDSDAAYETAVKKGKKAPNTSRRIRTRRGFLLEQTNKFPSLTWRVIWENPVEQQYSYS